MGGWPQGAPRRPEISGPGLARPSHAAGVGLGFRLPVPETGPGWLQADTGIYQFPPGDPSSGQASVNRPECQRRASRCLCGGLSQCLWTLASAVCLPQIRPGGDFSPKPSVALIPPFPSFFVPPVCPGSVFLIVFWADSSAPAPRTRTLVPQNRLCELAVG